MHNMTTLTYTHTHTHTACYYIASFKYLDVFNYLPLTLVMSGSYGSGLIADENILHKHRYEPYLNEQPSDL